MLIIWQRKYLHAVYHYIPTGILSNSSETVYFIKYALDSWCVGIKAPTT